MSSLTVAEFEQNEWRSREQVAVEAALAERDVVSVYELAESTGLSPHLLAVAAEEHVAATSGVTYSRTSGRLMRRVVEGMAAAAVTEAVASRRAREISAGRRAAMAERREGLVQRLLTESMPPSDTEAVKDEILSLDRQLAKAPPISAGQAVEQTVGELFGGWRVEAM